MTYKMYIGGYSSEDAGIYEVEFSPQENRFEILSTNNDSLNPVHIQVKDNYLFTANEIEEISRVSSFRINDDGALQLINRMDGSGHGTCDITVSDDIIYVANYGSGNIFSVVFEEDGSLSEVMSNMEHIGEEPRAHSTILSRDKKYLYEANLGLDRIFCYEVYPEGILRALPSQHSIKLEDNEGPRHMTISRDGRYLFVINEYGNSIYSYAINSANGELTFIEKLVLVDDVECYAADIHSSIDGRYLYASLRGLNEIALIEVNEGKLKLLDTYSTGGKWPRSFRISDDNEYLFITNQHSNNVVALKVDQNDGTLGDPLAEVEIFRPTTVVTYNQ